jgi:alpha-1,2-mannosyltransferase
VPFPFERLLDVDSVPGLYLAVVLIPLLWLLRGRRVAWIVAAAGAVACVVAAARAPLPLGLVDLDIYVGAARAWLDGSSIYDFRDPVYGLGSTYPPIASVGFAPLVPLSTPVRDVIWALVNVGVLFLTCRVVATRLLGFTGTRARTWTFWAFGLAAVTVPVWVTIAYQGQINIVLWFLVLADVGTVGRRSRWTGVGIGLATGLKLVPGLFVVWLLVCGERKAAARAVAVTVAVTAIGWFLAPSDSWRYWSDLLWDSSRVGDVADVQNNSLLGAVARVVPPGSARTIVWLLGAAAIAVVALWRARRATLSGDLFTAAVVVGCASALVSPISWTHHLGYLVLALGAITVDPRRRGSVIALGVAWLALLDPVGFGTDASTSSLRTAAMVVLVVALPIVPGRSRGDAGEPDAASPSGRRADDAENALDELVAPLDELGALDRHPTDHVTATGGDDRAELVEGLAGLDGVGAEDRAGLPGDERQLREPT